MTSLPKDYMTGLNWKACVGSAQGTFFGDVSLVKKRSGDSWIHVGHRLCSNSCYYRLLNQLLFSTEKRLMMEMAINLKLASLKLHTKEHT